MTYEYLVVQRTTRLTSGHETEELQVFLDKHAAGGWRFVETQMQTEQHQTIIFEREKHES